jgi:hypothetical protein
MTPDEIQTAARRIALSGIDNEIDDRPGIGEQLEDIAGWEPVAKDAAAAVEAVRTELSAIRESLAKEWGLS